MFAQESINIKKKQLIFSEWKEVKMSLIKAGARKQNWNAWEYLLYFVENQRETADLICGWPHASVHDNDF